MELRLVELLRKLRKRINNDKGHSFLYSTYGDIVKYLQNNDIKSITSEEKTEFNATIELLIYESKSYFHYRLYSLRCYQCANELRSMTEIMGYSKDIALLEQLHYENHFDIFVYTSEFKVYLENLQRERQYEIILTAICNIFKTSNLGRRPRDSWTERELHYLVKMGYELFVWYLKRTEDFESFPRVCEGVYIQSLQGISESYQRNNYCGEDVAGLNQSIDYFLSIYLLWSEKNPDSFVECLNDSFVHNLLELYEDDRFFKILTSISKVRNEKVLGLLSYYTDDDEIHIRSRVREIIGSMN